MKIVSQIHKQHEKEELKSSDNFWLLGVVRETWKWKQ